MGVIERTVEVKENTAAAYVRGSMFNTTQQQTATVGVMDLRSKKPVNTSMSMACT